MKTRIPMVAVLILCALAHVSCSRKDSQWFTLAEGETVVLTTEMAPRSQQEFDIKSTEALPLYLETDASYELMEQYNFAKRLPVRLEHKKSIESIATVKGAGTVLFIPFDGVIPLLLKNETNERLRVVVYRKKK